MYQHNCQEQVIKEFTGHRSLAVHGYQKTSEKQKRKASECIFTNPHIECSDDDEEDCLSDPKRKRY